MFLAGSPLLLQFSMAPKKVTLMMLAREQDLTSPVNLFFMTAEQANSLAGLLR